MNDNKKLIFNGASNQSIFGIITSTNGSAIETSGIGTSGNALNTITTTNGATIFKENVYATTVTVDAETNFEKMLDVTTFNVNANSTAKKIYGVEIENIRTRFGRGFDYYVDDIAFGIAYQGNVHSGYSAHDVKANIKLAF